MEKQRGLFEEGGERREGVFRRLPEEVRLAVRALLAELALQQLKARQKEDRDER
jgi:DNA-binding transcriptional ArsR family regulator